MLFIVATIMLLICFQQSNYKLYGSVLHRHLQLKPTALLCKKEVSHIYHLFYYPNNYTCSGMVIMATIICEVSASSLVYVFKAATQSFYSTSNAYNIKRNNVFLPSILTFHA